MAGLSNVDLAALRALAAGASDAALDRLVSGQFFGAPTPAPVQTVFERERARRYARAELFSPLRPFIAPGRSPATVRMPAGSEQILWTLARTLEPVLCDLVIDRWTDSSGAGFASAADDLCLRLAGALSAEEEAAATARAALDACIGSAEQAAALLELAPTIRGALPKLGVWRHQLTAKSAAELRTAFGTAAKLGEAAGPLFIEALAGHLDEPCHVLRLISLILDQPTDAFLAASALGPLAERLIVHVEDGVMRVRAFAPGSADADGVAVGGAVMTAAATLLEFEQWVDMGRVGPWGPRLAALRRALALEVEAHLQLTPKIMAEALPTRSARWTQRSAPRTPKLGRDPHPPAVARAAEQAAFLAAIRRSPSTSGFAALLANTCTALDDQLDSYVEGLLDLLHKAPAEDRLRLQAYLEVAALVTERFGGEPAGRIVRRRTAAA